MMEADAARIVNLIISTWPSGVKGHVWTDVLRPLNEPAAIDAYRFLRGADERPPSVARFYASYHAQLARLNAPDPTTPPDVCLACDDTGFVPCPPLRAHNPKVCTPTPERPCVCHRVEPCKCTAGRRADKLAERIIAFNGTARVVQPASIVHEALF